MNVRRVDLNLFRVFEAVMKHRGVAGAARELSLTPSAVSHALARLRTTLSDALFVPGADGMEPTPRALEIAPHVRAGLAKIDAALPHEVFAPATAVRTFRVAMSDYSATTLLPRLAGRLADESPGIDLRVFPFSRIDTMRLLDEGRLDLVIGWFADDLPERLRRMRLWEDVETLVARAGHPLTRREVTREALAEYPHVVVELSGSGEPGESGYLEERGSSRRVWLERLLLDLRGNGDTLVGRAALSVPHFASVLPIVEQSDMIATLPRGYAQDALRRGSVVSLPLPYAPMVGHLEAIRHERSDRDAALSWLIQRMSRMEDTMNRHPTPFIGTEA